MSEWDGGDGRQGVRGVVADVAVCERAVGNN